MSHPILTIFCPFTRVWAVDLWCEQLEAVEHDPALTNLCFVIDANEHLILNTLRKFAERRGYRSFHVKINEDHSPSETRIALRRQRIADVHNQSKDLIALTDGKIIIGLEDDTDMSRIKSFERLYTPLLEDKKVGFVEGVAMGRWGANIIGAWECDNIEIMRKIWTAIPPDPETVYTHINDHYQEITGGGWYGYATTRYLYLNCEYYTSTSQPWGPDVNFGIWLHKEGYRCLIDWSTVFGHRDYAVTLFPDPHVKLTSVVYNKNYINGKWDRTDYEQSN